MGGDSSFVVAETTAGVAGCLSGAFGATRRDANLSHHGPNGQQSLWHLPVFIQRLQPPGAADACPVGLVLCGAFPTGVDGLKNGVFGSLLP